MGTRSKNYIGIKSGIDLSKLESILNEENTELMLSSPDGTLIVYETNFTPMYARPSVEDCTYDLEEEIRVQRFLGSIPATAFYMKRAGEEFDYRGEWETHAFLDHPDVANIEKIFAEGIAL